MRRRIAGVETEYGIACLSNGKQCLTADDIAHRFFTPVIETYHLSHIQISQHSSPLYKAYGVICL